MSEGIQAKVEAIYEFTIAFLFIFSIFLVGMIIGFAVAEPILSEFLPLVIVLGMVTFSIGLTMRDCWGTNTLKPILVVSGLLIVISTFGTVLALLVRGWLPWI